MKLRHIAGAILVMLFFIMLLGIEQSLGDSTNSGQTTSTQSNTSGSNTHISGGYSQESTTTYQSGSSSNTTSTTNNSTSNAASRQPVSTASAPSMQTYSQRSCIIGLTGGFSIIGFSGSLGSYVHDEHCQRIADSTMLSQLGLKIAAIARMCEDEKVFESLLQSGTPCPILHEGKSLIGAEAMKVILDRRKPENEKIEQYRKYKESLRK
tara:strand:+ start:140 stop:766 length:627 start_codon:yes stop_codon:yes gene_type:complete